MPSAWNFFSFPQIQHVLISSFSFLLNLHCYSGAQKGRDRRGRRRELCFLCAEFSLLDTFWVGKGPSPMLQKEDRDRVSEECRDLMKVGGQNALRKINRFEEILTASLHLLGATLQGKVLHVFARFLLLGQKIVEVFCLQLAAVSFAA